MKNIEHRLVVLIFLALVFPYFGSAQDSLSNQLSTELNYEVNIIYPPISISKEKLVEAHTLIDLNAHYKSSWVREYSSVEISTNHNGTITKAVSKDDTLSKEQKNLMNRADLGEDIAVKVRYLPENTLKHNDIKEINFSFTIDPDSEATYAGGKRSMLEYLKENAIDKIPEGSFKGYDLTVIKFTINEAGAVIDARIFGEMYQPSRNEKIDQLLLETVCNMPNWQPAQYANGFKVKQEFALTVGNMENCMMPLLNIRGD